MQLTEAEYLMLITEATNGRYIGCTFGSGWVRLDDTPDNAWAIRRVREARTARTDAHVTGDAYANSTG